MQTNSKKSTQPKLKLVITKKKEIAWNLEEDWIWEWKIVSGNLDDLFFFGVSVCSVTIVMDFLIRNGFDHLSRQATVSM